MTLPARSRAACAVAAFVLAVAGAGCPSDAAAPGLGGDTAASDGATPDTANAASDSATPDTAASDSATPDTAASDSATPDAADTAASDSATPDGADTARDSALSDTGGAVAAVLINEVVAQRLDGGDDWIELYNAGAATADLGGWTLSDAGGGSWAIPDGTALAPGAFVVFEGAAFGFGLGKEDAVTLSDAGAAGVDVVAWTEGAARAGWSYGRLPDGKGAPRTLNHPTPGTANDDVAVTVVLNEVVAAAEGGGDDWIELFVPGPVAMDVSGWTLGDDSGSTWVIGAGASLAPGERRVFTQTDFGFGLGAADAVLVLDADGVLVQATSWQDGDAPSGASWGRSPDGSGPFTTLGTPTPGAANP